MEKSKPMELGLGELLSNQNIVNNNSFRFINRDLGIVISFAQMESILFLGTFLCNTNHLFCLYI